MKITRINRIKKHRVFDSFAWPGDLADFGQFNLIYGWNGSGKTTLSNLFCYLERLEPVDEGEVDFHIDGKICPGTSLGVTGAVPIVRVFNRSFVNESVFTITQELGPIYFFGKDSVEKQKQADELRKKLLKEQQIFEAKSTEKNKVIKEFDEFCIREAKAIKDLLSSSGSNHYNNYDKSNFKAICAKLVKLDPAPTPLTDEAKSKFKQQKNGTPKDIIAEITAPVYDFKQTREKVEKLLQRTVVSQVMEELLVDASAAEWVQEGLRQHTGNNHRDNCRFCTSPIPEGRIAKLEAHFNDAYSRFLTELDAAIAEIVEFQKTLTELQLPDKAKFYEHLVANYIKSAEDFRKYINQSFSYFARLKLALMEKRTKPFENVALETIVGERKFPDADGSVVTKAINGLIVRHNIETENFQTFVSVARKKLEEGMAVDALADFKKKTAANQIITTELEILQTANKELLEKIRALDRDTVEHLRPTEELNAELRSYLGRDELKFELFGNGYRITRHGAPAENLSEGERSAIAFLYFLKSLQARGFTITNDIIVIDDPVSSLDANAVFCAFGYMKDRTKDAGQLFILTHNFGFFRQVKNWFNHLPHQRKNDIAQRPARFYMMEAGITDGKRNATLKQLDPLLHQFESEYHYLFKKVHEEANNGGAKRGLEEFYGMPNIARRLLESFMAFRYPAESGELKQQLDLVTFDPAKKARILRFLHTYSHDGKIAEPEHDLSILAETPEVLKDLLEMLKTEDPKHCDKMIKLLTATGTAT